MTITTNGFTTLSIRSELTIELDQWLEAAGIKRYEIDYLHIGDTFPARTSMVHFLKLVVNKLNAPMWSRTFDKFSVSFITSENDISEFLNKFWNGEEDVYKFLTIIENFETYKIHQIAV